MVATGRRNDEIYRKLAEKIAMRLFTNGIGQVADRLVMERQGRISGEGWCMPEIVEQILNVLKENE